MNTKNHNPTPDDVLLILRHHLLHSQTVANQEAERKQNASYLNDTAVQSLTALNMQLSLLLSKPQTEIQIQEQLADSLSLIINLMEGMTMMARSLRPLELDTIGLNGALQQACEEIAHLAVIPVKYKGVELSLLPEIETLALYRLTQEAFVNILKHAKATKVQVSLHAEGSQVKLIIEDNGRGFKTTKKIDQPLQAPGLSLFGLMVRFQQLNGHITIQSTLGKGTIITAVLPYP